jgi:hypothetical protein
MSHAISIYNYPDQLAEVRELLNVVKAIAEAPNKDQAAKRFANPGRPGWSWKNLQTKWAKWEASGRNELALLDRRRHIELQRAKVGVGLPEDFVRWAGGQMLGNQRKSRAAWREIIRRWQAWRATGDARYAIPGYDSAPPPADRSDIPFGWSYDRLMKKAKPADAELAIARVGTVAAKKYLPIIPGTREGIRFLEWVFFDDVVHDRKIIVPGTIEPVRLLQLGGLDYASGVYLKFGLRPDLTREDGTRDRLKRRDFLFLVAHLLLEYGWPADYVMHIVCERGTATMSLAEAQFLYDISEGQIRVGYTSMEGQFVLAWDEAKSGNAAAKGPIESWHNLFHNELGSEAGQVGKDRHHSPAALMSSDRHVAALNKAALLLTPEQRQSLRLPYPTLNEAHARSIQVVQRINRRRDHEMESFDSVLMWRLPGVAMDWQPEAALLDLPPAVRETVEYRTRLETPLERLQRLSHGVRFIRPHPGALVRLYEDSHTVTRLTNLQAIVEIENKSYTFGPDDPLAALPNGTEVFLHHAPIEPTYAIVTSGGKFVGVWRRQLARRTDADSISAGNRRKASFINHAVSQVRGKMLEKLVEQDRQLTANLQVLEDAGVLPSEADHALSLPMAQPANDVTRAFADVERIVHADKRKTADRARAEALADDILTDL